MRALTTCSFCGCTGNQAAGRSDFVPSGGSWSSVSDRIAKENFASTDGEAFLARLREIPILAWNFKTQDDSIRHIGPMAQDFRAAFGLGEDDKHIATVDADGVAAAGVQALYRLGLQKDAELRKLQAQNRKLAADTATTAATATNALNLGSVTASSYARVDAGNTFSSTNTFTGEVTFGAGGITNNGGGLKHTRATIDVLGGGTGTSTLTWATAFADADYTATCQAYDPNSAGTGLKVIRIRSVTASTITVDVANDAGSDRTG